MAYKNIVWRDHGTYDVNKLWNKTKNIKTNRIYIDKVIHNLDKDLWTIIVDGKPKYITPNQVIKNPSISPLDFNKINNADLQFPIIIYVHNMDSSSSSSSSASRDKSDLDILDGLHRLAKAVILKHKTIKVKYVTTDILQKCRV